MSQAPIKEKMTRQGLEVLGLGLARKVLVGVVSEGNRKIGESRREIEEKSLL